MLRKCLAAVGVLALLAGTGAVGAEDATPAHNGLYVPTVRLNMPDDTAADTLAVCHRGFWGGFYRPAFGYASFGGFRPYGGFGYSSFYRPAYGFSYSYYSRPIFSPYSYGYSYYYSSPGFYYPRPAYYSYYGYYGRGFCPICGTPSATPNATTLGGQPYAPYVPSSPQNLGQPASPGTGGILGGTPSLPVPLTSPTAPRSSFQYDGGPANPVPQPEDTAPAPAPTRQPGPASETRSLLVSLPPQQGEYTYPAFGESTQMPPAAESRFAFPAFGHTRNEDSGFAVER